MPKAITGSAAVDEVEFGSRLEISRHRDMTAFFHTK